MRTQIRRQARGGWNGGYTNVYSLVPLARYNFLGALDHLKLLKETRKVVFSAQKVVSALSYTSASSAIAVATAGFGTIVEGIRLSIFNTNT